MAERLGDLAPVLAVIPARGGSKGLPGKNIRPLAGIPLIAHTIMLARMCPEIDRLVVTTDSEEIAAVAAEHGAPVPFLRPAELARDETAMWPVLQHALAEMERREGMTFGSLLLLDPTSPGRLPKDIAGAFAKLVSVPDADGIIGVSQPEFNPIWTCVVERDGRMADLVSGAEQYGRRQDVPTVYRINASLYVWRRRAFAEQPLINERKNLIMYEIPEQRAIHIDEIHEFTKTELFLQHGLIEFPWLDKVEKE